MHQILLRQNRVSKDNFESIWNVLFCQMITGRGKIKMVFGCTFVIGLCKSFWWREGDVDHDLLAQEYHKIWIECYRKKPKRLVGNIFHPPLNNISIKSALCPHPAKKQNVMEMITWTLFFIIHSHLCSFTESLLMSQEE